MNLAAASLALAVLVGTGVGASALVDTETGPEATARAASGAARSGATRAAAAPPSPGPAARDAVAVPEQAAIPASEAAAPRGLWRWPLLPRPPVVRRFLPPTSAWGAGHRGVDLGGAPGAVVHAVADGTVTHTGVVAGRPTVTLSHPGGLRSTYEPVRATVTTGDVVRAGDAVGVLVATGSHCAPAGCLHLGALRGTEYLDPLSLLGPRRVRLLPLSPGGPAAPARAPGG